MSVKSVVRSTAYNGLYKIIESVANARDPSGQFVIFSDPRGGSTWLTEIIATIPGTEILWEPLHLARVPEFAKLSFAWRQHIPEDQEWEDAYVLFNKLFSGRLLNHWICSQTTPLRLQKAESLIVKFCRANALIPWLTKQFSFHHAPVYMIRHPFSVVASQLEWGAWDDAFTGFHIPDSPHN
ncbi:MAG: hypothetical protein ACXW0H_01895, partial [Methylobacter sp.]